MPTERTDPREAFPDDVAAEFEDWTDKIDPPLVEDEAPLALEYVIVCLDSGGQPASVRTYSDKDFAQHMVDTYNEKALLGDNYFLLTATPRNDYQLINVPS